jgi:hypothetical protein
MDVNYENNINGIEVWKDIPSFEGHYKVSSFGNVKSLKRGKETLMKKQKDGGGYLTICACKNSKQNTIRIHIAVAMAFHGHKPDGTHKIVVDHIDNNKLNNRADNLKLITQRENASKDRKGGASKFVGVTWNKKMNKWAAHITYFNRSIHLGCFELETDAKKAYDKALKEWEQGLDLNILYPKRVNSSKYEGVYWDKKNKKWAARYKDKYLGRFKTEIEAYEAREIYILNLINYGH